MDDKNLFYTVMEADGDLLEPFTPTEDPPAEATDQQQGQTNEQPPSDMGAEDLPPEPGGGMEDLSFDENGGDMEGQPEDENQEGEGETQNQNLSQKANDVLNQQLYQQLLNKNDEIQETLENLQAILPILPSDVVAQNDKSINRLNRVLTNAQDYALNKFVNLSYGENLMYYQKISSLYTLLQNEIDSVLKKFQKDSE
jgi:hypothetical protein